MLGKMLLHPRLHQKRRRSSLEPKAAVPDVGKDKSNNSNDKSDGGWKWSDSSKIEDENPVSEVLV